MLAIIRVFTSQDNAVLLNHETKIRDSYDLNCKTYCIPDQPRGIYDAATEKAAEPKIVAIAKQAEADGARCILISCASDPAIEQVRKAVKVPVLGAGSCAAALALTLGSKIGVLNLTGKTTARMQAVLGNKLVAEAMPQGVHNTTDLLKSAGVAAALAAAKKLSEDSDVIVFGCTGYTTIGLAKQLKDIIKIPVVDAVEAAGNVAVYLFTEQRSCKR